MEMGNSRGRAVYEANIPDGFRRPQTDSYAFLFQQCHSSNDENFNIFFTWNSDLYSLCIAFLELVVKLVHAFKTILGIWKCEVLARTSQMMF